PTSALSRNSDFMKLWTGFTIARVGSQITVLALPLTAVLLLGAGATETGLLVAAQMAPSIVAGLFIGVWVDRLPRRPIMIVSDVGSAIVIATVPLAAALGTLSLAQLYVVSFLGGAFAVATDLARAAFVPSLVGRTRLVAANSRLQASNAVAQGAGPSLGGILVQVLLGPRSLRGAALAGPLTARWGLGPTMVAALFLETLSRLLLPFAGGTPVQAATVLGLSQALLGLTVPLWVVGSASLVQALTPEHLLGRVSSATRFVGFAVAPPAAFAAGIVGDLVGLRPTLFASAVIAGLAFLYLFFSPVRRYQHPMPQPEPA